MEETEYIAHSFAPSSVRREREGEERTLARAKHREREKRVRLRRLSLHSVIRSAFYEERKRYTYLYPTSLTFGE